MNLGSWLKKNKILVTIIIAILGLSFLASGSQLAQVTGPTGFNQGTQGLDFTWAGVLYNNQLWSAGHYPPGSGTTSPTTFGGASLSFSPGNQGNAANGPALCGQVGAWTPTSTTPDQTIPWNITQVNADGSKTVTQVEMYRYPFHVAVDVYLAGTYQEAVGGAVALDEPSWANSQVWLKIEPQNFVYFQNAPSEFAIAPALIQCNGITWGSANAPTTPDTNGDNLLKYPANSVISNFESIGVSNGAVQTIYYNLNGAPVQNMSESNILSIQGQPLDPSIFRNSYYMKIDLSTWEAKINWAPLNFYIMSAEYPSVKLDFTGYVYVIGQWVTYFKPSEVVTLQPHPPQIVVNTGNAWINQILDAFSGLAALLSLGTSSLTWLIIIVVLVLAVIYIFRRKNKGKSGAGSTSRSHRYYGLSAFDWFIVGALGILTFMDISLFPLDVLTGGSALGYYIIRSRGKHHAE